MRNLKRALAAVFVLLLAAVVLFFVLENQQAVSLVLFGWAAPEMPVAVLVLAALVIGLAVGPLLGAMACSAASARSGSLPVRRHSTATKEISYILLGKSHLCMHLPHGVIAHFIFGPGECVQHGISQPFPSRWYPRRYRVLPPVAP